MEKSVVFHLGAHKTATTYIQNTLWKNKSKLANNKIAYIPLNIMRSGITSYIVRQDFNPKEFYNLIISNLEFEDYEILIISDENIIGGINDIQASKQIAPLAKQRIEKIVSAFSDSHEIYCHFAVREYASYYASIYCECLRHLKKYETFETFLEGFNYLQFSWQNIINELVNVIDLDNLFVYSFEYFIENELAIFKTLTSQRINDFDKHINLSEDRKTFRHKTIEIVDHLATKFNNQMIVNLLNPINAGMLSMNRNKKFNPFNESELNYFEEKYKNDLVEIKNLNIKTCL